MWQGFCAGAWASAVLFFPLRWARKDKTFSGKIYLAFYVEF